MKAPSLSARQTQRGAALIVGMIFLLVLTMLGISAIQTSSMEERMSGNLRDSNASFQAAEAALRVAENILKNRSEAGLGYYATAGGAPDPAIFSNWTSGNAAAVSTVTFMSGTQALVKTAPLYMMEMQEPVRSNASADPTEPADIEPFMISAYSTGGSGEASVALQSAYRRKIIIAP